MQSLAQKFICRHILGSRFCIRVNICEFEIGCTGIKYFGYKQTNKRNKTTSPRKMNNLSFILIHRKKNDEGMTEKRLISDDEIYNHL